MRPGTCSECGAVGIGRPQAGLLISSCQQEQEPHPNDLQARRDLGSADQTEEIEKMEHVDFKPSDVVLSAGKQ